MYELGKIEKGKKNVTPKYPSKTLFYWTCQLNNGNTLDLPSTSFIRSVISGTDQFGAVQLLFTGGTVCQ